MNAVILVCFAVANPVVPEHYEMTDLPEPIALGGISAGPGLVVVELRQQVAIMDASLSVTLEWDNLGRRPRAMSLGPTLGMRITDRPELEVADDGIVDFYSREVLLEGDGGIIVPDIDGNGYPDVHGFDVGVHLQQPDGSWWLVPYPTPEKPPDTTSARFLPVGDVDGDGFADVLYAEDTDLALVRGLWAFQAGHLELFRGGPDGYEATPAWTLDFEAPVADAVAVQNDDDAELELLLLGGDDWETIYPHPPFAQLHVLDVQEGVPSATPTGAVVEDPDYNGAPPHIEPFDDVDGDGRGDIVFFAERGVAEVFSTASILASSTGWDPAQPAFVMTPWAKDGEIIDHRVGGYASGDAIADIDQDGHLDIVTGHYLSTSASYLYIWYPLREASPKDTGVTSDTGASDTATTDTGSSDTGPTTPTEPRAKAPDDEARACGCASTYPIPPFVPFPLVALVLRRRPALDLTGGVE